MVRRVATLLPLFAMVALAAALGCSRRASQETPESGLRGRPTAPQGIILSPEQGAALLKPLEMAWLADSRYRELRLPWEPTLALSPGETAALINRLLQIPRSTDDRNKDRQAAWDRARAAAGLAQAWGDDVIGALVYARDNDPYWDVHRAAKRSLAKISPKRFGIPHEEEARRLVSVLRKHEVPSEGVDAYLRGKPEVEMCAVEVQAPLGPASFAPRADIERARSALVAIGARAVEPMLDRLEGMGAGRAGYPRRVQSVLVGVGRTAVPSLLPAIERADTSYERRHSVVRALGDIGDPRALPALRSLAEGPEGRYVRRAVEEAIGKIETVRLRAMGREAVPELIAAVEREPYYREARRAAIRALGNIGDARALPVLRRIANTADSPYRRAAEEAIANIEATEGC